MPSRSGAPATAPIRCFVVASISSYLSVDEAAKVAACAATASCDMTLPATRDASAPRASTNRPWSRPSGRIDVSSTDFVARGFESTPCESVSARYSITGPARDETNLDDRTLSSRLCAALRPERAVLNRAMISPVCAQETLPLRLPVDRESPDGPGSDDSVCRGHSASSSFSRPRCSAIASSTSQVHFHSQ